MEVNHPLVLRLSVWNITHKKTAIYWYLLLSYLFSCLIFVPFIVPVEPLYNFFLSFFFFCALCLSHITVLYHCIISLCVEQLVFWGLVAQRKIMYKKKESQHTFGYCFHSIKHTILGQYKHKCFLSVAKHLFM